MEKSKKSIRKKIFISHINIVAIFILFTVVAFNVGLNYYIRKQTKTQLLQAAKSIEGSMVDYSKELKINTDAKNPTVEARNLLKINKNITSIQSFLDIKYVIIGQNKRLIYPEKKDVEEYNLVQNNIIPIVSKNKFLINRGITKNEFNFNVLGNRYEGVVYPLKALNENKESYLVVYSNLVKSNGFTKFVNQILLIILVITAIISLLISNRVSRKISLPISQLSSYAKKIGERQYDAEIIQYDSDDEIGQLAETMESMVEKLSLYDNTMKTFMQNASHELRTPLMSIQGYAEGIKYGVVNEEDKAVDIIIEESKRLSSLVEDLLYLSRIESTQENFNFEETNIEYVIRSSIDRVSGIAVSNNKNIKFASNDNSVIVMGDQEKITRSIINILGNCLRYCIETIEVTLKKENDNAVIIVEDDGPGFDEKEISNIFNRFFKGKGGNYGLGLTIAKSIIEKHGGIIAAENKPSCGARFKIYLPQNQKDKQ